MYCPAPAHHHHPHAPRSRASAPPARAPQLRRERCRGQQAVAAAGGGAGGGSGGRTSTGTAGNGGSGSEQPPPPGSWRVLRRPLQLLAAGAGGVAVLGLLQPWRLLLPLPTIDTSQHGVSIIIPVLNEAAGIGATLAALQGLQPPPLEVIVVDGGSTDGTVKAARRSGVATQVLQTGKGRARQMNAGAAAASGQLLAFLHADTVPPRDLVGVARRELRGPHTVLVGFVPSIEVPGRRLWLLSLHNLLSSFYAPLLLRPLSYMRGLRCLFGDQTLCCRACDFQAVGGFDSRLRIMEDADLCIQLHEAGPCCHQQQQRQQQQQQHAQSGWRRWVQPRGRVKQLLSRTSVTSGRRLDAWGPLRATAIHARIGLQWYLHRGDPAALEALYVREYTDAHR